MNTATMKLITKDVFEHFEFSGINISYYDFIDLFGRLSKEEYKKVQQLELNKTLEEPFIKFIWDKDIYIIRPLQSFLLEILYRYSSDNLLGNNKMRINISFEPKNIIEELK